MAQRRVQARTIRNSWILVVYAPGSTRKAVSRRVARRPFATIAVGDRLRDGRRRLRVVAVEGRVERRDGRIDHVTEVFTRAVTGRRRARQPGAGSQILRLPPPEPPSVVAQFLRFHVLVRVYEGDADAWLADLRARGDSGGDLRFVRWIRSRLRREPALLAAIRRMVAATPFWCAAGVEHS